MRHGLGFGWGAYAAICAVAPLLWGLAVYWALRGWPERRSEGTGPHRQDEADTANEDFRI